MSEDEEGFDYGDNAPCRPRPWEINPNYWNGFSTVDHGHDPTTSPILDADGREVFRSSEWLSVRIADVQLIVDAVNKFGASNT